jgi:hypothetical protein
MHFKCYFIYKTFLMAWILSSLRGKGSKVRMQESHAVVNAEGRARTSAEQPFKTSKGHRARVLAASCCSMQRTTTISIRNMHTHRCKTCTHRCKVQYVR